MRTVPTSRWRPGGQSSYDLTREFVQELPEMTAADAWQRSVELVSRMPLDPTMEPRVKASGQHDPPRAENPFFWAGFLLADTGSLPRGSEPEEPIGAVPLAIKPIGAAVAQKPDAGEMKPDAENKPAAADDPVGGGLGLRRQPEPRQSARRQGAGRHARHAVGQWRRGSGPAASWNCAGRARPRRRIRTGLEKETQPGQAGTQEAGAARQAAQRAAESRELSSATAPLA